MEKISLCITSYNRCDMTVNSFLEVLHDDRIDEIIIVDDCSDIEIYNDLKSICDHLPKVKLYRNKRNLDCYLNKYAAIKIAKNDWCIIFDSDNTMWYEYLDTIYACEWDKKVIYAPIFAKPNFDYTAFSGLTITKENINQYWDKPMFQTALNTSNYFFNRKEFIKVFDTLENPITSEALYTNYNWLVEGNSIYFVPNLTYDHLVHSGSHYVKNNHKTVDFNKILCEKYKMLK